MRPRHRFAVVLFAVSAVVLAVAAPAIASAAPLAAKAAATTPMCDLASPEAINGAQFVNNETVNGTWTYSTGVACASGNLADIALYEQVDFNGAKVSSLLKGFTGVARDLDAITTTYHCAVCTGTWLFEWGQILKAPAGLSFVSPPAGCVVVDSGLYEVCVQTKTVTL
jgi:hypothetical protein